MRREIALIYVFLLSSVAASADTVSGTAGSGFQSWAYANINEDGKPYWDTPSFDGANQSIGFLLTNHSPTPLPGAPGAIPFWGNAYNTGTDTGGGADFNFFFNKNSPSTQMMLQLEISAHATANEFGWYDVSNPSILNPIFLGSAVAGSQQNAVLPNQYGFYLRALHGGIYRTQSSLNAIGEQSHQHFSLFQESATAGSEVYWLGIEDLSLGELSGGEGIVGDYNDMVIRLACVPESSSFTSLLLASGGMLVYFLARRNTMHEA